MIDVMSGTSGRCPKGDVKCVMLPWTVAYLAVFLLQGGPGSSSMGLLSNIRCLSASLCALGRAESLKPLPPHRSVLWVPVSQASYRRIAEDMLSHVLDLDLKFHLARKTGEVTKVMDRGTSAVQDLMSILMFNVGPSMLDVLVACVYIAGALQPW